MGKVFVKRALRDVVTLANKVHDLDIDALDFGATFDHLPPEDELQILAQTLQNMT